MLVISANSPVDPCVLTLEPPTFEGYQATAGRTPRAPVIDPTKRTLVLIVAGQSQGTNTFPTLNVPVNAAVIDCFNFYDGAVYDMSGPVLGAGLSPLGPGSIHGYLADLLIPTFHRVIVVPVSIGSTAIADWATGFMSNRIPIAIKKLATRGITPATTGVTMAMLWMQGENDAVFGTSKPAYQAAFGTIVSTAQAAGFSGRIFVCRETWAAGVTSAPIQSAQVALVNNVTIFSGGDLDSLGAGSRQADNTHFNDAGASAAATLIFNAMHASGAPF